MATCVDIGEILSGLTVVLATNDTQALQPSLFYNLYEERIAGQYTDALRDLGANVVVLTLDETLDLLASASGATKPAFVVNICAAFKNLECEGLIPAVAALSQIACFPCRGDVAIIAEEKIISKHLASSAGFKVAKTIRKIKGTDFQEILVRKPINGGDSKGIELIQSGAIAAELENNEFAEPFINGPDLELFCVPSQHLWDRLD
nr:hypothetical protein [uncultured Cohaesibacter sp.]